MSDYLDHLTAKALDLTERIQPRLASLFEPPSAAGRPIAARWSAKEEWAPDEPFPGALSYDQPISTQESFSQAAQSRPPMIGLGQPAGALPQQPTGSADASTGYPPGQWANRQPSPLLAPQAVDTAAGQRHTHPEPNPAHTTSTATPLVRSSAAAAGPLDAKTPQPSHPAMLKLDPVTAGQEIAGVHSTHAAEQDIPATLEQIISRALDERAVLVDVPAAKNVTQHESVSDGAIHPSKPAMTVIRPHVTSYREPPVSSPSEGTAMPEPTPTIRITIGRVDVRAVMPAAPVPRPSPVRPSPALSLEDYLKQREGGRR